MRIPFSALELGKLPFDKLQNILLPTDLQLTALFDEIDDWFFAIFSTLALTGFRPGELVHLLIEDIVSHHGSLQVRNRPDLCWQLKTRPDRAIPFLPAHTQFLNRPIRSRALGTLFRRMHFSESSLPPWEMPAKKMAAELNGRQRLQDEALGHPLFRKEVANLCRRMWFALRLTKTDQIRTRLLRHSRRTNMKETTTSKVFRHLFATIMQDARVDLLIRKELLGHIPENGPRMGGGTWHDGQLHAHPYRNETVTVCRDFSRTFHVDHDRELISKFEERKRLARPSV